MNKAWMNISHSRFILFYLKIFGEIVTTFLLLQKFFLITALSLFDERISYVYAYG